VARLPYQLNPAAGPEAINKLQYYNDKFGPARVAQIIPNMQVHAALKVTVVAASQPQLVEHSVVHCF
jgi:hypothetical protein